MLALLCLLPIKMDATGQTYEVFRAAFIVNVVLGVFNMLPIPPLDGSRVIGVLMTPSTYARWMNLDQYGFIVLFGLIFIFRDQFQEVFDRTLRLGSGIMGVQVI